MASTLTALRIVRRRKMPGRGAAEGAAARGAAKLGPASVFTFLLFAATMLSVWVSFTPFADLRVAIDESQPGSLFNQIAFPFLAVSTLAFTLLTKSQAWRVLLRPTYFATMSWFLLSALASDERLLSLKRLVLTGIVVFLAAMLTTLPGSLRSFANWISGLVVVVLVVCYLGVLFVPELSIHSELDFAEPNLAGNWRGVFPHKNLAGAVMASFAFIGLFVAKVKNTALGWSIVVASVAFLVFSASKTSMLLFPVVLCLAAICDKLRGGRRRAFVALALLTTINFATVGSVSSPAIKAVVDQMLPDASFTGRTDIWQFAVENIRQRPILGYGFATFWQTNQALSQTQANRGADEVVYYNVNQAKNAHNGYLDIFLQTGLVGLSLTLIWVLVLPLRDSAIIKRDGASHELGKLFFRIWLFGINVACLESILFEPVEPVWFMMLVSMFGMRMLSRDRLWA